MVESLAPAPGILVYRGTPTRNHCSTTSRTLIKLELFSDGKKRKCYFLRTEKNIDTDEMNHRYQRFPCLQSIVSITLIYKTQTR